VLQQKEVGLNPREVKGIQNKSYLKKLIMTRKKVKQRDQSEVSKFVVVCRFKLNVVKEEVPEEIEEMLTTRITQS
jgi:hypothetical protein